MNNASLPAGHEGEPASGGFDYWVEYLFHQGAFDLWADTFEEALAAWRPDLCRRLIQEGKQQATTATLQGLVYYKEGVFQLRFGEWERARDCFEAALAKVDVGDLVTRGYLLGELGMVDRLQGKGPAAVAAHRAQLRLGQAAKLEWLQGEAYDQLGLDFEAMQAWGEAQRHLEEALQLWHSLGQEGNAAVSKKNLGLVLLGQERYEEAEVYWREVLEVFTRLEREYDLAQTKANLGTVCLARGDGVGAAGYYQEALAIFDSLGMVFDRIGVLNNLGGLAVAREEWLEAASFYEESLALARDLGQPAGVEDALLNLAVVWRRQERWPEAMACYAEAAAVARAARQRRRYWQIRRRQLRFWLLYTIWRVLEYGRRRLSGQAG